MSWKATMCGNTPGITSICEAGESEGRRRMADRGVGLIAAVILVAARKARAKLWTLDRKLYRLLQAG